MKGMSPRGYVRTDDDARDSSTYQVYCCTYCFVFDRLYFEVHMYVGGNTADDIGSTPTNVEGMSETALNMPQPYYHLIAVNELPEQTFETTLLMPTYHIKQHC